MCTNKRFSQNVYKWAKLFKDEGMPGMPKMSSTPEMVDSVKALILVNRIITIEDISEQLRIFERIAYEVGHDDLAFSGQ